LFRDTFSRPRKPDDLFVDEFEKGRRFGTRQVAITPTKPWKEMPGMVVVIKTNKLTYLEASFFPGEIRYLIAFPSAAISSLICSDKWSND